MKIHVITDEKGDILATVQAIPGSHGDLPIPQPIPSTGQKIHEVELPKELHGVKDVDYLHRRLKEILH